MEAREEIQQEEDESAGLGVKREARRTQQATAKGDANRHGEETLVDRARARGWAPLGGGKRAKNRRGATDGGQRVVERRASVGQGKNRQRERIKADLRN